MKSLLLNIKNSIPYFILISIYFIFINIEAKNNQNNYLNNNKLVGQENKLQEEDSEVFGKKHTISIPIIPYKQ